MGLLLACLVRIASAEIALPQPNPVEPIVIQAEHASTWTQGSYEVWLLRGDCRLIQGATSARSREAVLWIKRETDVGKRSKVIAYLEGAVTVTLDGRPIHTPDQTVVPVSAQAPPKGQSPPRPMPSLTANDWLGEFFSVAPLDIRVKQPGPEPVTKPAVYVNGMNRLDGAPRTANKVVRPAQFAYPQQTLPSEEIVPGGARRMRIFPRSGGLMQFEAKPSPDGRESIGQGTNVNLIVDGLPGVGSIDVSADRIVVWTAGIQQIEAARETLQREDVPLEIYLDGNIEFRQGDRVIYAQRMYYNVRSETGVVLQAEILSPLPDYNGLLRLKSDLVRQTGRGQFLAENSFVTSSRMSRPGYRLQSGTLAFSDQERPVFDPFTGNPELDPETLDPVIQHDRRLTSWNNFVYLGDVPVFYWPKLSTNLEEPSFFLRRARVRNDRVFGTQILTDWDVYQLLGFERSPEGTDWTGSIDWFSERGFGAGTIFKYNRNDLFGIPGPYSGLLDAWGIEDNGLDNLGLDRRDYAHPSDRGRVLGRHRQELPNNFRFTSELGFISDMNFLEEWYKREWDQNKDYTTGLELKQTLDNMSWSITADSRINNFFTTTEWLPRLDHFWLGQPLLGDRLTWFEHSQAAYAHMRVATAPTEPQQAALFTLLPWEGNVKGGRFATRQELDLPFDAGPFKIVPYGLGELAHWGEVLDGDDLTRVYGQAGVRASIPFWAVNSFAESSLLNVHGLAHKMVFDIDASYADANRDVQELPLYDPLDDDAQEQFRRRFTFNTFSPFNPVPAKWDPRFYALRSGLASSVTSPSTEVADDMTAVRFGLRQRWQTKRGLPDQRRIIDWIVFDTEAVWFPQANRDNFGTEVGLVNYDFRWHLGDRFTLLSDGMFDFFSGGLQTVSIGGFLTRPPRGSLYVGLRSLRGPQFAGVFTPVNSQVLTASYSYRMSPKWISSAGATVLLSGNGTVSEHVALTRVGESMLVSFAFDANSSQNNIGANLLIEPRFMPKSLLGRVGGAQIPQAGLYGLE